MLWSIPDRPKVWVVRVPVEEELVVVRQLVVAADVLHPGEPLEEGPVHAGSDVLRRVVADRRGEHLRLKSRVDVGEVVRAATAQRFGLGIVGLVGGVERHDRELVRIGVVAQRLPVLRVVRRRDPLDERREVLLVLPWNQLAVAHQPVLEHLTRALVAFRVGRSVVPQGQDLCLHVVGKCGHLGCLVIVAEKRIRLCRGPRARVPERGLRTVLAVRRVARVRVGPAEGDRVGVVAGQEAVGVLDEVVAVRVVLVDLPLDVALGVVGEVLDEGVLATEDLVDVPALTADVLLVGVAPAERPRVVGERRAARGLTRREQVAVGIDRVAEVLQVLHVHGLGQLDRVVVPQDPFQRHGELVVVARDVRVDVVEAVEERPVVRHLLDVLVRDVDVRDVVDPPLVVLGEVGAQRLLSGVAAVALVLLVGFRQLLGGRAELELEGDRLAGRELDVPDQIVAVGRETVAAEPRCHGRDVISSRDGTGPLGAVGGRLTGRRRGRRDGPAGRRAAGVGQRQQGHGHVVVGDELRLLRGQPGGVVHAGPVARVLRAITVRLGEGRVGDADGVHVRARAGRSLAIRPPAAEAEVVLVMRVHEQGAAPGVQLVAAAAAGGPLQDAVDPVRIAAGCDVGVMDGPEHACRGVECRRLVGNGVGEAAVRGRAGVDLGWDVVRRRRLAGCRRQHEAGRQHGGKPASDGSAMWSHVMPPVSC